MAANTIVLKTSLPFDVWTGMKFSDWLKEHYSHISDIVYNPGKNEFTVKGVGVSNDGAQFLADLNDFIQGKPKTPRAEATDLLLDDLPSTQPSISKSWECPSDYKQDRYAPFLEHIASLTGTQINYDELIEAVVVVGKDEAVVEQTLDRLTSLHSALSLLSPSAVRSHHHIFLPSKGYDKLQVTPFKQHAAAVTTQTVATPAEWNTITSKGVLVPFRPEMRQKMNAATPRLLVASRFLASQTFKEFGNSQMYNETPSSNGSSVTSAAGRVLTTPNPPEAVLTLRPKEYVSILASEKADQVTKWMDLNTKDKSAPPVEPQQSVPPEEYPPEQRPVPGLLKRRPRTNTSPLKDVQTKAVVRQGSDEPQSVSSLISLKPKPAPVLHQTMQQKPSPGTKPSVKQTTLDKYWSSAFTASKEKTKSEGIKAELQESSTSATSLTTTMESKVENVDSNVCESSVSAHKDVKEKQKGSMKPAVHADSPHVLEIFNALQPTLEAAMSFPGTLQLEAHIELVTIAPLSSDGLFDTNFVTLDEWKESFQPKKSNPSAPFFAWNKVTGSGADVDALIDLIWSKKVPQRIFHEMPADLDVVYEYHCRMKDGSSFIITLDDAGHPTFQHTPSVLGCSTVHFPHRMWDMNIILKGAMNLYCYQDPAIKQAIDEFIKSIYFKPGESLIIFCSEPADRIFSVVKILMKRSMRHQHQPMNQETKSKLMLKTVEVQEFLIARKPNHPLLIRGRIPIKDPSQCVSMKKLWYEVSIVSDEIQKLLRHNRDLQLGEQTKMWAPVDLLGEEIELKDIPYDSSEVANSVGASGLGGMYRLAKAVLDRMKIGE